MEPPISIVLEHCGHVGPQAHWHVPRHVHDELNQLVFVVSGQIEVEMQGQTYRGKAGHMLYYRNGCPHEERSLGDEPLETFYFGWSEPRRPGPHWPAIGFDCEGRVAMLLRWLFELSPGRVRTSNPIIESLVRVILHEYATAPRGASSDMILRMRRFVLANLSKSLSLDELADEAGVSKFHFARIFRQRLGQTPMQYVRAARVEAARSLLLTTRLPLKAIARATGFADEYHLSKVFRRQTGHAPGAVRRSTAGG